jgi:hypothetical protein
MELCLFMTVALFFVISMFATLSSRPMVTSRRLKKLSPLFYWVLIFLVSSNKSNDLLIHNCPLAIMATNHIEIEAAYLEKRTVINLDNFLVTV